MPISKKLKILLYGSNIWYLSEGMLGPLFAIFTQRLGGNILEITWAWAIYLFVTGILYICIGRVTDNKYDKAKFMVAGYGLNAVFTFGYLLVSAPWHLFILQAGFGLSNALATPTWFALYSMYGDRKQDGLEWGLAGGEAQMVTGIAIILGGLIVTYVSFTALFIIMGIIQVAATIIQSQILWNSDGKTTVKTFK